LLLCELPLRRLLLRKLHIGQRSTDQHCGSAEQLADCLAKIIFNVDPRLRIPDGEA